MVLIRRIHNRGANIVVEANGEILFFPGGDVANWQRRFSARVREGTIAEAPANRRPRWAHYGNPLKATITASTTAQPGRMKVYSAVGSSAPYAAYVDQGTGIYGGNGPYEAKILPPWHRGSPSLYEHTWKVPHSMGENMHGEREVEWEEVGTVTIKGQKGQHFFDKGLKRGFQSMRMRSAQLPIEGKIGPAMRGLPASLLNVLGNTPADAAFVAQLEEWRAWRDAAWRRGDILGEGVRNEHIRRHAKQKHAFNRQQKDRAARRAAYKQREAERSKRNREKAKAMGQTVKRHREASKPDPTKKPKRGWASVAQKKAAALAQFEHQNPGLLILKTTPAGVVVRPPKGTTQPVLIPWSRLYHLID